ncbi:hypothetical protein [Actinomadura sp. DC4]|uniref:LppU/SCO3897 family protein n=1 Tax=Actinomadura sp. DC4 TaxID=3055069 RepID=UPI0025B11003|nr:hypothetical protein [Actinomadura sp. DC4]MDN3359953.1 hypothetical protein [Actinomadura sp. DC4]
MGGFGPPSGPPGPPGWGPPGPPLPPRRPNNGGAVIVILLAVFVVLIGGVAGLWFVLDAGVEASSATSAPSYSPPAFPTPTYSPPSLPTYTPYSPPDPPSAPPTTYSPAFDPQPGDCVRNTGTYAHPHLYMSTCTPGHYRIIDRIDDTTNTRRCASTGYTYAVWFNSPAYVLCMRGL